MRRQCCIAGRSRPAPDAVYEVRRPRGLTRGACLADIPARLFLCSRCREQVLLCSRCDRGQRYCGPVCSGAARRANQRDAARRYQRGSDGRIKHAARQRRWRERKRRQCMLNAVVVGPVTHHGSPDPDGDAPLRACPYEPADLRPRTACSDAELAPVPSEGDVPEHKQQRCGHCATALSPWVRQGFLRRRRAAAGAHLAAWPPRPRDLSP